MARRHRPFYQPFHERFLLKENSRPAAAKSLSCARGGGRFANWCRKGCNLPFLDHLSSGEGSTGYNPPRRRGLRIVRNSAPYSGIAPSLRRSSSPKHNHYVGLCLGPLLADSPLCTRGPLAKTAPAPDLRPILLSRTFVHHPRSNFRKRKISL